MTTTKNSPFSLMLFLSLTLAYGCKNRCSCDCEYYEDAIRLTAKWSANDSIIATKILYTHHTDTTNHPLTDSILKFQNSYSPPNYTVIRKDSIYNYDRLTDLDCDHTPKIYVCECAK
jgi:hypothetical protein